MNNEMFQRWLKRATEDLIVARLVLSEQHMAHVCFLSQQCLEKSLKAYLLEKNGKYPRTHRLVDLLGECTAIDKSFSTFLADCIIVDQYYIPTRYPDAMPGSLPDGMPSETEAKEAIAIAEKVLRFVKEQLLL